LKNTQTGQTELLKSLRTKHIHRTLITLDFYIRLQAILSGLSRSNFKDHYGETVKEQCLDMIAEIDEFLVYDEML